MATSTMSFGTSNVRSSSRQTRINPARTSRTNRSNLRQNSLVSNPSSVPYTATEPQGFYPAITHFSDAIAALPREYRRHTSLLKEVDAKAWFLEEGLQTILEQCLREKQTRPVASTAHTIAGSASAVVDDAMPISTTNSINGLPLDTMSQFSTQSADFALLQRRQMYGALRQNLKQMMITMDEKNHVINNANEDLSRHIRRLDRVWSHITDEISEEARLGSLKHWAYTETNPIVKKTPAVSSRREAAASLATLADNDIAHRSESRREAMLAKKQRLNQPPVDSDLDDKTGRKTGAAAKGKKVTDAGTDAAVATAGVGKRKAAKVPGGTAMERTASGAKVGGISMSREPSQQDASKKRKAPVSASTAARKRLNANALESPKLVSSPLANVQSKDAVKRSPALTSVRPVASRGRQNSTQSDTARNRPSSSMARNVSGVSVGNSEVGTLSAMTGRTTAEVKNSMKEFRTNKGEVLVEDRKPVNGEPVRGGIVLERTTSRQGGMKREAYNEGRAIASPRLGAAMSVQEAKGGRGRASKTSTPTMGTFEEADAEASSNGLHSENGASSANNAKLKRAPRPRIKDHHGLHDSLSPKGLPMKRTHNKTASFSSVSAQPPGAAKPSSSRPTRDRNNQDSDEPAAASTMSSRSASRNAANTQKSASTTSNSQQNLTSLSSTSINKHKPHPQSPRSWTSEDDLLELKSEMIREEMAKQAADQAAMSRRQAQVDTEVEAEADIDVDADEDEQRYCYCHGVSYGEMVACDNKNCPREWFHLECIGLRSLPRSAKWYCDECKENLAKKGRFGNAIGVGGNGHGSGNGAN